MKIVAVFLGLVLAGSACAHGESVQTQRAHVRFTVKDAQVQPAIFSLEIYEDGSGDYTASYVASSQNAAGQQVDETIHIHGPLLEQLFRTARAHHFFAFACENSRHRVAYSGMKTMAYAGPDGAGSCTFNYSRDQWLNQISDELIGVSSMLEFGVRLKQEHQYDRLALDGELASLEDAVRDRRALEPENIAPVLEAIASDNAVMKRARDRARAVLSESTPVP